MIIIPQDRPIIEDVNSYYVNIHRLIEHYQGRVVSGAFYFNSMTAEGVIFFDKDAILGGTYTNVEGKYTGREAVDLIISSCDGGNFSIGVYEIDSEKINYWSNIPSAERIYDNLSTEFTDLQGLLKKMGQENLTGYIEVSFDQENNNAWVFFHQGKIIGITKLHDHGNLDKSGEFLKDIVSQAKSHGGVFHVNKVSMSKDALAPENVRGHLEALVIHFEDALASSVKAAPDFELLLRKKMVEKADHFSFLDPFAGEFAYAGRKLEYQGGAGDKDLIKGVTTCLVELAKENGFLPAVKESAIEFIQKHGHGIKLSEFGF
jgi:hypothetical protein